MYILISQETSFYPLGDLLLRKPFFLAGATGFLALTSTLASTAVGETSAGAGDASAAAAASLAFLANTLNFFFQPMIILLVV